jgi:hypothetical protein
MLVVLLFGVAAVGGIILAALRLKDKPLPMGLALAHGGAAAAGLVVLAVSVLGSGLAAGLPLALFLVAALGGFALFSFHLRKKALPIPVMLVHGGVAAVAFVLLLLAVAGG